MSQKVIKKDWSLDKIIEELGYETANSKSVPPYNRDRQVVLSFGSLVIILKAIRAEIRGAKK